LKEKELSGEKDTNNHSNLSSSKGKKQAPLGGREGLSKLGKYGPASSEMGKYGPASSETGKYGPASSETGKYGPASSEMGKYGPASSETGKYGPASSEMRKYGPASKNEIKKLAKYSPSMTSASQ
jgi:hypothetical protein